MTREDIYETAQRYGDPFTGWMFSDAGPARFARQIAEQAKAEERKACAALAAAAEPYQAADLIRARGRA